MANTSISSLSRGLTGTLTQTVGSTSSDNSQVRAASASGQGGASNTSRQSASTATRQVVNVDGESLNPNARRGTYLNILV
ncbi:MAG TPA: hypothetical protein VM661_10830 [Candidatus Sulfotelmatobacter sp.]|jgi:hypothetical protein|nr:hypothetical protein [Candidatus Sulfotelmatobacter sp.]